MSVFDTYSDTPFRIKQEGQEITVRVNRTSPTTVRVSWNLPKLASCGQQGAYNGAIITADQTPTSLSKLPVDGTVYAADATGDPNLNAGDRIGSALVVGAFYNDVTTTFMDITDVPDSKPLYISLHAVDAQYRYHTDGVHGYSLPFGKTVDDEHTPGYQIITLGSSGVTDTTKTNLKAGTTYHFKVQADCYDGDKEFSFDGVYAQTYGDLIRTLNKKAIDDLHPIEGTFYPGTGTYWYDSVAKQVKQFNGTSYSPVNAIVYGSDPFTPTNGTHWFNTVTKELFRYNTVWSERQYVILNHDPRQPYCDDLWYDPINDKIYQWTGNIWEPRPLKHQATDPQLPPGVGCYEYWFDGKDLYRYDPTTCKWVKVLYVTYPTDYAHPKEGDLWINTTEQKLYQLTSGNWSFVPTYSSRPPQPTPGTVVMVDNEVEMYNGTEWVQTLAFPYATDPRNVKSGDIWYNGTTFKIWSEVDNAWIDLNYVSSDTDPTLAPTLQQGTVWYDDISGMFQILEGTSWVDVTAKTLKSEVKPQSLTAFVWYNPREDKFYELSNGMLNQFQPIRFNKSPAEAISDNTMWYSAVTGMLKQWDPVLTNWVDVPISTTPVTHTVGTIFYNTNTGALEQWNGKSWSPIQPCVSFSLDKDGNLRIESKTRGSKSYVRISDAGNLWNSLALGIPMEIEDPMKGTDPISSLPTYMQPGVGTDGSQDERRLFVQKLKNLLGYPVVEVELTKEQMDVAIDNALAELRQKSSAAYKRGYFMLDTFPRQQHYVLSDETVGFNKVIEVLYLYRLQSAYLGTAQGAGVYGQIAIQQLYTYGKFDLVSYHMVSEYIELMQQMFANEIQFKWDEYTRTLSIFKDFYVKERVLVDAVLERTEQDLMTDRWTGKWLQKYALAQCRLMLAAVRGKFTSITAAGGPVVLDADALRATAEREMQECQEDLDNYIVMDKENWGMASDFVIG